MLTPVVAPGEAAQRRVGPKTKPMQPTEVAFVFCGSQDLINLK